VTEYELHSICPRESGNQCADRHHRFRRNQDYAARVAVTSRDEIGLLGTAFNKMAEDLTASHAQLFQHKRDLEKSNSLLQLEVGQRSWEATHYHQSYVPLNAMAGARKHFEVLIRMIDEEGNLVLPGSFLPAAERYNLMPAIDRWVVGTVFANYHVLAVEHGGGPLTCAINLSGTSLNAEGFLEFVRQQALEHALPPHSICFEMESDAVDKAMTETINRGGRFASAGRSRAQPGVEKGRR
jgi:predicted signal transduction protein with EAL and GGDEF domain